MFVVYFFSFKNILYGFIFIKNGGVAGGLIDPGNLFFFFFYYSFTWKAVFLYLEIIVEFNYLSHFHNPCLFVFPYVLMITVCLCFLERGDKKNLLECINQDFFSVSFFPNWKDVLLKKIIGIFQIKIKQFFEKISKRKNTKIA